MSDDLPARLAIAPHPARGVFRRQLWIGSSMLVCGGALLANDIVVAGLVTGALGGLFTALAGYALSTGRAAQIVNRASAALSAGELDDAVTLLDHAEKTARWGYIRRVIDLHRAQIALRRGALDRALAHADAAVRRRMDVIARGQERMNVVSARALRAFLRASTGDAEGARADIEAVRAGDHAVPESLARVELAAAMLLERAGDHAGLRDHLAKERTLLIEHSPPRERAIVTAYQRMLKVKAAPTTVYRRGAPREAASAHEPPLADWVSKVAPAAAAFVRETAPLRDAAPAPALDAAAPAAAPADVDAAARAAAKARAATPSKARGAARVLLLWALLIAMLSAIWHLLAPDPGSGAALPPISQDEMLTWISVGLPLVFVGLFVAMVGVNVARAARGRRRIVAALATLARGDEAGAAESFTKLTQARGAATAAQAHAALAGIASRQGRFDDALAHCNKGIGELNTEAKRAGTSDMLLPGLFAERAAVFAALGRSADARAELAIVIERYPSFPSLATYRFVISLIDAARRGDVEGVAALARQVGDVPLSPRGELLADLARATAQPEAAGAGEIERLEEELRTDEGSQRWIAAVAPDLLAAFRRASEAAGREEEETGEEEEREAAAEEEALAEGEERAVRVGG